MVITHSGSDCRGCIAIRRQRGIAHLDGLPFDDGLIDRAERAIDAEAEAAAEGVSLNQLVVAKLAAQLKDLAHLEAPA